MKLTDAVRSITLVRNKKLPAPEPTPAQAKPPKVRHALFRTSPKGRPFAGTCRRCGKTDLSLEVMDKEECANDRHLTDEDVLLEALNARLGGQKARETSGSVALKSKHPGRPRYGSEDYPL